MRIKTLGFSSGIALLLSSALIIPEAVAFEVQEQSKRLIITRDGKPVAHYIFQDDQVIRGPFFAHVHTPGGIHATRNHPPIKGTDETDHEFLHPGIWHGWGRVGGYDFWRNRNRIEHVEFIERPAVQDGALTFSVRNHFMGSDGPILDQTVAHRIELVDGGYLLQMDLEFRPTGGPVVFEAHDEMGFGIRVATPLTVNNGGKLVDAGGNVNEPEVRGSTARWADYRGEIDGKQVGITAMPHPKNPNPAWYHARNYGVLTTNPFPRHKPSETVLQSGETLRLRFAAFVHEGEVDIEKIYNSLH
jgi:hypothetical protein